MSAITRRSSSSWHVAIVIVVITLSALGCGQDTLGADAARDVYHDTVHDVRGETSRGDQHADADAGLGEGSVDAAENGVGNYPPEITDPGLQTLEEEQEFSLTVELTDPDGDALRVFIDDLPPGARWDEAARTLVFQPDFTQGGRDYHVTVVSRDAEHEVTRTFTLTVNDTIAPPWPTVVSTEDKGDHLRLKLAQTTDAYLDSPGYAGRSFDAFVTVPKLASTQNRMSVRVDLHGLGSYPEGGGSGVAFDVLPHDPHNTYWWGYAEGLPGGSADAGVVPNYTQRRVLHLLQWVLETYPGADRERTYVTGGSMGGAGAKLLGLLYARHFCYVEAIIGQAIPRNHRPLRVAQLTGLLGAPDANLPVRWGTTLGVW
ncbi:MAG: hypothetical protein JRH20_26820, partial [Deltaproteobacteria bacterium]|nr:hypothetical protein [Deltaproteobacteria bacterium]